MLDAPKFTKVTHAGKKERKGMENMDPSDTGTERSLKVDRAFVLEHGPWMLGLANRVLLDPHLAEDAIQEALMVVHNKGNDFDGRSEVRTWLYRVTINAALTLRRKRAMNECDIDELQPDFDANACRIEEPWPTLRTTDEVLEEAELTSYVRRSVEALPEAYRICLQLRDFEELSVREVSEILDISVENVKVRTHRARSALKRLLEPLLRGRPVSDIASAPLPAEAVTSVSRIAKGVMMAYMPMMITCEQFEDFIMDYLEDALPKGTRRIFEFHIRACRECREYLAAYQRARDIARETVLVPTLNEVPEDLIEAVTSALGKGP
jgi:RNA polymerase sigma-70 factor (ECF subfamily)